MSAPKCDHWCHWPRAIPAGLRVRNVEDCATGRYSHVVACDGKNYVMLNEHSGMPCGGEKGDLLPFDDYKTIVYPDKSYDSVRARLA